MSEKLKPELILPGFDDAVADIIAAIRGEPMRILMDKFRDELDRSTNGSRPEDSPNDFA